MKRSELQLLTPGTQISRRGKVFFEVVSVDADGDYTLLTRNGSEMELRNDGGQYRNWRELHAKVGVMNEGYEITRGGFAKAGVIPA